MLNGIFKLANVTRPGVIQKNAHSMLGCPRDVFIGFTVLPIDEMLRQKWDVFFAFSEWR